MTDQYATASAQVDKLAREKVAYINEIDEMKLQLRRFDKEASMVRRQTVVSFEKKKVIGLMIYSFSTH